MVFLNKINNHTNLYVLHMHEVIKNGVSLNSFSAKDRYYAVLQYFI